MAATTGEGKVAEAPTAVTAPPPTLVPGLIEAEVRHSCIHATSYIPT